MSKRLISIIVGAVIGLVALTAPAFAATTNWNPSGQAPPRGNLPHWHQLFVDDFANMNLPQGSFKNCQLTGCEGPGKVTKLGAYPDGLPDTSQYCDYYPSRTMSVQGGVLDIAMRTNTAGQCMDGTVFPNNGKPVKYMKYSVRFKAQEVPGYKMVFFLWPANKTGGEVDWPEVQTTAPTSGLTNLMRWYVHNTAGNNVPGAQHIGYQTNVPTDQWHTATLEWTPSRLTFYVDNKVEGTTTQWVPQTPMYLEMRAETDLPSSLGKPPATARGALLIDWVTEYQYTN